MFEKIEFSSKKKDFFAKFAASFFRKKSKFSDFLSKSCWFFCRQISILSRNIYVYTGEIVRGGKWRGAATANPYWIFEVRKKSKRSVFLAFLRFFTFVKLSFFETKNPRRNPIQMRTCQIGVMRRNETFAICGNNYRINVCAETKRLQFVGIIIGSNVGAEMKRLQCRGQCIRGSWKHSRLRRMTSSKSSNWTATETSIRLQQHRTLIRRFGRLRELCSA